MYLTWPSCIESGSGCFSSPVLAEVFSHKSEQHPAIQDTSYEFIGMHIESVVVSQLEGQTALINIYA